MTDRRRIDAIFDAALDLEEPELSELLDRECSTGPEREAVVRLLAAVREDSGATAGLLSTAVGGHLIRLLAREPPGGRSPPRHRRLNGSPGTGTPPLRFSCYRRDPVLELYFW